ncbi:centrosomal protein of 55 kDa-like [Stigmatopora nigra]
MSRDKKMNMWPKIRPLRGCVLNIKEEWTVISSMQQPEANMEMATGQTEQPDSVARVHLTQHNEELSGSDTTSEMRKQFENWLLIGPENLAILKQRLDDALQDLAHANIRYKEKTEEADELRQKLQNCSEEKVQMLKKIKELRFQLDEEKRRNTDLELESSHLESLMLKRESASLDKISDLQQQVRDSSVELEDEMENSSYLKIQLLRVLNKLQTCAHKLSHYQKQKQQGNEEEEEPIYQEMRPRYSSTPNDSSLEERSLDCPVCQIRCPISQYRQMMDHLEVCLN